MADAKPKNGASAPRRWRRRLLISCGILGCFAITAYCMHCVLLLSVARVAFDHDSDVAAQERADGVTVSFSSVGSQWVSPMKNLMNPIWKPIEAKGINYYTFGAPRTILSSYSERSNPSSPYYQAWLGAYVTKRNDGTLPPDLSAWATQVTSLDQKGWLEAMGDPKPLADSDPPERQGTMEVDGKTVDLWHGRMRSHSDLSADPHEPLASLVGMPPATSWPAGVQSFQDVTLDGYFVAWNDDQLKVSVVVYTVAAIYGEPAHDNTAALHEELLRMMKSARTTSVQRH